MLIKVDKGDLPEGFVPKTVEFRHALGRPPVLMFDDGRYALDSTAFVTIPEGVRIYCTKLFNKKNTVMLQDDSVVIITDLPKGLGKGKHGSAHKFGALSVHINNLNEEKRRRAAEKIASDKRTKARRAARRKRGSGVRTRCKEGADKV